MVRQFPACFPPGEKRRINLLCDPEYRGSVVQETDAKFLYKMWAKHVLNKPFPTRLRTPLDSGGAGPSRAEPR